VNKKTVESLIKAGAFLQFGTCASFFLHYPRLVKEIGDKKDEKEKGQFLLFTDEKADAVHRDRFEQVGELDEDTLINMEKEVIGFLISKNPLAKYKKIIDSKVTKKIGDINKDDVNKVHVLVGVISGKKIIKTKKDNSEMAFLTLFDDSGTIEGVVFPSKFVKFSSSLNLNNIIIAKGKITEREGRISILIDNLMKL